MFALRALAKAVRTIQLSPAIEGRASTLEGAGLKPLDALHLAFAEAAAADYFCICDDRLLKRERVLASGSLKPVSPVVLIGELEVI